MPKTVEMKLVEILRFPVDFEILIFDLEVLGQLRDLEAKQRLLLLVAC